MPNNGGNNNNARELSAEQVQLVGELLIPAVKQEMRPELHLVRTDLTGYIDAAELRCIQAYEKLDARVKRLESIVLRAMLGYGAIITIATWAFEYIKLKYFRGE